RATGRYDGSQIHVRWHSKPHDSAKTVIADHHHGNSRDATERFASRGAGEVYRPKVDWYSAQATNAIHADIDLALSTKAQEPRQILQYASSRRQVNSPDPPHVSVACQ